MLAQAMLAQAMLDKIQSHATALIPWPVTSVFDVKMREIVCIIMSAKDNIHAVHAAAETKA
jgi:hypothetical protein